MACTDGSPTYCLISARSMNAKSIAAVMFEVVSIITLGYLKHQTQFLWHQVCCYSSFISFLCFVNLASQYIRVKKTNLMHYLSSVYFINEPLHVSDVFIAIISRYTIYIQQLVLTVLFSWLSVVLVGLQPNQDNILYYKHARNM